jgi:hypothetical protein
MGNDACRVGLFFLFLTLFLLARVISLGQCVFCLNQYDKIKTSREVTGRKEGLEGGKRAILQERHSLGLVLRLVVIIAVVGSIRRQW